MHTHITALLGFGKEYNYFKSKSLVTIVGVMDIYECMYLRVYIGVCLESE